MGKVGKKATKEECCKYTVFCVHDDDDDDGNTYKKRISQLLQQQMVVVAMVGS